VLAQEAAEALKAKVQTYDWSITCKMLYWATAPIVSSKTFIYLSLFARFDKI